jgi:predicted Holliday junction resolvase-like endonuclease
MDIFYLIVGVVIGAVVAYLLLRGKDKAQHDALRDEFVETYRARAEAERACIVQDYEARIHELENQHTEMITHARQQSANQSRAVLKGKMAEQIAPLLPGFAYWPADARFLGDPVDYVIFNGYSAVKDSGDVDEELEVVILDIKQGKSTLTSGQRQIARAVAAGHVRFEVVRVFADGTIRTYTWGGEKDAV